MDVWQGPKYASGVDSGSIAADIKIKYKSVSNVKVLRRTMKNSGVNGYTRE